MRYKKILFCIPPFTKNPKAPIAGVGYLSTFLTHHDIKNDVFDMTLGYKIKDLFKKIEDQKPDLIGLFLMTYNYDFSYNLIHEIKEKYKIDIIVGGPHVSTMRKKVLKECQASFAIKLEGEYPLLELINGKKLNKIKGLIYRKNGKIVENPDQKYIHNLDNIPFPTYEKFELEKYAEKIIPIISSRGCPYSCIYCPVKVAIGKQFRMKSAKFVIKEIEFWYNRGYKKFDFQDDNFTLMPERIINLCKMIKEKGWTELTFNCPNGIRADKINRNLLKQMRSVGFETLAFGVEAGNNRILNNIKKGEKIEEIEKSIKDACDLGFNVVLFFLVGSPGETISDVEDSIKLALKYPIIDAFFYSIVPYPETELYEWIKQNNYFTIKPENYLSNISANDMIPLFATPEFQLEEKKKIFKRIKIIQREIRRKSINRRYGLLGRLFGGIFSSNFADEFILNNKFFFKIYDLYLLFYRKKVNRKEF